MPTATFESFCSQFEKHPHKTLRRFCALQAQGDAQSKRIAASLAAQAPAPAAAWLCHSAVQQLGWLAKLDNRAVLKALRCAQFHILGEKDQLVPAPIAHWLASCPDASVRVLPGVAHVPHLAEPETLARMLKDWRSGCESIAKSAIAQSFSAAAAGYDRFADLQKQVAQHLLQLLPAQEAGTCLDLGCGTGYIAEGLEHRGHQVLGLDIAQGMLRQAKQKLPQLLPCAADAEALPLIDQSIDLVASSLSLQWCRSLNTTAGECWRVLKPGGIWAFSTLTEGTLLELKNAWAEVDEFVHVNDFLTQAAVTEQVCSAGFKILTAAPVVMVKQFEQLVDLLRALKGIGAHNMNAGRPRALTTPTALRALERSYTKYQIESGHLPATYNVFFIIAQKV